MVTSCSAPNCATRFKKGSCIRFFRFPKEDARRRRWIMALRRVCIDDPSKMWEPADHDRVCSLHFITGAPSKYIDHVDFVPSIFCFTPRTPSTKLPGIRHHQRKMTQQDASENIFNATVIQQTTSENNFSTTVIQQEASENIFPATVKEENDTETFSHENNAPVLHAHENYAVSVKLEDDTESLEHENDAVSLIHEDHNVSFKQEEDADSLSHEIDARSRSVAASALLEISTATTTTTHKVCDRGTDPGDDPLFAAYRELHMAYSSLQSDYQFLMYENRKLKSEIIDLKFSFNKDGGESLSVANGSKTASHTFLM